MKCPICGAEAHYIPQEGFIIGWGYIVCKNNHSRKAWHLAVGINATSLEVLIFLNKEDLICLSRGRTGTSMSGKR